MQLRGCAQFFINKAEVSSFALQHLSRCLLSNSTINRKPANSSFIPQSRSTRYPSQTFHDSVHGILLASTDIIAVRVEQQGRNLALYGIQASVALIIAIQSNNLRLSCYNSGVTQKQ